MLKDLLAAAGRLRAPKARPDLPRRAAAYWPTRRWLTIASACAARRPLRDVDAEAQVRFAGEHYFQVLARIMEAARPRSYVEIGVAAGDSLRLVKAPTVAIGIDPQPQLAAPLAPHQKVFVETSDAFFAGHDLRAELGGLPVDLALIDGMHHFEFALRLRQPRRYAPPRRFSSRRYPLDRETAGASGYASSGPETSGASSCC